MPNEKDAPILERLDAKSAVTTAKPEEGVDWLNEGLPDLEHVSHHHFDLVKEFDISCYIDILADEVNSHGEGLVCRNIGSVSTSGSLQGNKVDRSNDASTVAPLASAWAT
jgi:hypothetical protein